MINPVVYNYNSTIYPYVKIDYQRNAPVPVNKINAVTLNKVKYSEKQAFINSNYVVQPYKSTVSVRLSNPYDKARKSAEETLLKGSNINLLV